MRISRVPFASWTPRTIPSSMDAFSMASAKSSKTPMSRSSTRVTTIPCRRPAREAGPSGSTLTTLTPCAGRDPGAGEGGAYGGAEQKARSSRFQQAIVTKQTNSAWFFKFTFAPMCVRQLSTLRSKIDNFPAFSALVWRPAQIEPSPNRLYGRFRLCKP